MYFVSNILPKVFRLPSFFKDLGFPPTTPERGPPPIAIGGCPVY